MLEKSEAIILKTTKYGESSLIAKMFTEKFGLIPIILKGIRTGKRNNIGLFQPGYILDLNIYYRENKQLLQVKDYNIAYSYKTITQNISKQSIVLFLVELLSNILREQHINREIYLYIKAKLQNLDRIDENIELLPLQFLYELTQFLGFEPLLSPKKNAYFFNMERGCFDADFNQQNCLDNYTSLLFYRFLAYQKEKTEYFNSTERNTLLNSWLIYYKFHVPEFRIMQTPQILHDILH